MRRKAGTRVAIVVCMQTNKNSYIVEAPQVNIALSGLWCYVSMNGEPVCKGTVLYTTTDNWVGVSDNETGRIDEFPAKFVSKMI